MKFEEWLDKIYKKNDGTSISKSTIYHYISGLSAISKLMLEKGIINKRVEYMTLVELDSVIEKILNDKDFIIKDKKGNNMYSNSIKKFRCYKYFDTPNLDGCEEEKFIENLVYKRSDDNEEYFTEKESIIKARKGQGIYRRRILKEFNNKCIITGIDIQEVLIASHIKPWAACNNYERLSKNNGLMLSATYDKLFDCGLITFDYNGKIIISKLIDKENLERLHLIKDKIYDLKCNSEKLEFLKYHNKFVFVAK